MSYQAVNWALAQDVRHSAAKFLLVVMAHYADKNTWESFLAVKRMTECTGQDRKTVIVNIARLIEEGFIADTKRRVGETGQIPVYLINGPKNGTASDEGSNETDESNGTEFGTAKESQKRDALESGNSTVFPHNSTVFPLKQSQISLETVPKTVPVIERLKENRKKEPKSSSATEIPDWVPDRAWKAFVEMRQKIKKPLTEYAKELALKDLQNLVEQGQNAEAVINQSVLKSWQGFFAVKAAANGTVNRHGGFGNQDYRSGVAEDGSF